MCDPFLHGEEKFNKKHKWLVVPGPDTGFCVRLKCDRCKEVFEQDMYSIAPKLGCRGGE
jgi:hypothetical protein